MPPNHFSKLNQLTENQNTGVLAHSGSQKLLSNVNQQIRSRTPRLVSIAQVLDNFHAWN
jgi:hypothetical protein